MEKKSIMTMTSSCRTVRGRQSGHHSRLLYTDTVTKREFMSSNPFPSSTLLSWRLMFRTLVSDVDLLPLCQLYFGSWRDPLTNLSRFPTSTTTSSSLSHPSISNDSEPPQPPPPPLSAKLPCRACCGISHFLHDITSSVVALR